MGQVKYINDQLIISGKISFANVQQLFAEMQLVIAKHTTTTINMTDVSQSDSSGLALLLACLRYAKATAKQICFVQLPKSLESLARLCGVTTILGIE